MEKQKLAEMVMERMRKKKQEEERNRPHYEVLRLEATFEKQINDQLKEQVAMLETLLGSEKSTLKDLQNHLQDLDNTGKRVYPRIIVMPDFIATEHVQGEVKQFYRKSSASFLRNDIIRNKNYVDAVARQKEYIQRIKQIGEVEISLRQKHEKERKILNDKRVKVLKQDLRLRFIIEEQRQTKQTIEKQKYDNRDLLKEYEIKKLNLQNRKNHLKYVEEQVALHKQKIEQTYNPVTYREHLQTIFDIQIKTQTMQKHLVEVTKNVHQLQKQTEKFQRTLERAASLTILGKTFDSPSTRKGKIQKRLEAEKSNQGQHSHRRSMSAMSSISRQNRRPQSQNSIRKSMVDLDFSKINSTAKHSQRTTDRSSSRQRFTTSELSRPLF